MSTSVLKETHADEKFECSAAAERALDSSARSISPIKAVLSIAIAIVSLLCLLEAAARIWVVAINPTKFGNPEFDIKYGIATKAPSANAKPELFFLGTSHTNQDVYPELLVSELKKRNIQLSAINLAVSLGLPENQSMLLQAAIAAVHQPAAVFYDISPLAAADPDKTNSENLSLRTSFCGGYTFFPATDPSTRIFQLAQKYSYSVRYRSLFKGQLMGSAKSIICPDKKIGTDASKGVHQEISLSGWAPYYEVLDDEGIRAANNSDRWFIGAKRNLQDSTLMTSILNRLSPIQATCQKYNVPLFLLWTPERIENESVYKDLLNVTASQFLTKLSVLCADRNIQVIDMHAAITEKECFSDCGHLNATGAVAFTTQLADAIKTRLPDIARPRQ